MDGWQQDWMKTLESVTDGIDQFFQDVGKGVDEAADALLEFTEKFAEEIEQTFAPFEETVAPNIDRLDDQITEWLDPLLQMILGFEATLDRAAEPITHTVEPLINQHPVCVGCQHYHGQAYSGTMLVCAMHPYGITDGSEQCPDKETYSWFLPPVNRSDDSNDNF